MRDVHHDRRQPPQGSTSRTGIRQVRWHIELNRRVIGFALWVPWCPAHRPLIYAFWTRTF